MTKEQSVQFDEYDVLLLNTGVAHSLVIEI